MRASSGRAWTAVALIVGAVGVFIGPRWVAQRLVGDGGLLDEVTAGVWIFKVLLVLHAAALVALGRWGYGTHVEPLIRLPERTHESVRGIPVPVLLAGALLLALGLRIVDLGSGLWHDEIATLVEFGRLSTGRIISTYTSQNQHPLYSLLASGCFALFGESAGALRLPAVLLGVASLGAVYTFGTMLVTRRESLIATLLLAVSYHHVWFSQNARGYTGLMLFTLVGTTLYLRLLAGQGRNRHILVIGYAASMALAVYTHLTAAFAVMAHFIVWAVLAKRRRAAREAGGPAGDAVVRASFAALVLAGTLSLQLYALVLPQLREPLFAVAPELGDTPWRNPLWLVAETMRGVAYGVPGGWFGLGAGIVVALAGMLSFTRRSGPATALMVLPGVLIATALVALNHNLWPRFFFFAAGFAVLITVRGVFALAASVRPRSGPAIATVLLLLVATASATTVARAWGPKQDYAAALAWVERERGPADTIAAAGLATYALKNWLQATAVVGVEHVAGLERLEADAARTFLIYSFPDHLRAASPPLWRHLRTEYQRVAEFPGTLGGGTVFVMSKP